MVRGNTQVVYNSEWVFATVLICPQPLILSISQAAFQCLHTFGAQELPGLEIRFWTTEMCNFFAGRVGRVEVVAR